jgi:hypothetical protein
MGGSRAQRPHEVGWCAFRGQLLDMKGALMLLRVTS